MKEYNSLSSLIEDLTNENRTLREMAQVPPNFGIKIENIKLLNKEKIEDYRKLINFITIYHGHMAIEKYKSNKV